MLLYAECMAKLNPINVVPSSNTSAVYWVELVRARANNPMSDQPHLYSARESVPGQLPLATDLMTTKGWSLMDLLEHERYVELYMETWRGQDIKRWQKGADYIKSKSGWKGYQSLTLPIPLAELDANPNMPKD